MNRGRPEGQWSEVGHRLSNKKNGVNGRGRRRTASMRIFDNLVNA